MDVSAPVVTRRIVNADNVNEYIEDTKRNQYTPNKALKKSVLQGLIHCHVQLGMAFVNEPPFLNLSFSNQITSHLMTLHNVLRQASNTNKVGKLAEMIPSQLTVTVDGAPFTTPSQEAAKLVKYLMSIYGLEYVYVGANPPEWYGVAAPFLTFMSAFNNRMNEVRTGCDTMPISKSPTETKAIKVSQYGLSPAHHCLLDGISFPPHKRSSLAQSIGAMTQLIMVHRTNSTPSYEGRWKKAAMRSIGHLPKAEEIVNKARTSTREEVSGLLELVADILLVTGSRSACKAYFPFSIFYAILSTTQISQLQAIEVVAEGIRFQKVEIDNIEEYDHSGKGAFSVWNKAAKVGAFSMHVKTSDKKASEIIFHSVWGTHWEDLNTLEFATGHKFHTRRELGDAFKEKGNQAEKKNIKLIPFEKYAKLSQALPTEFSSGGQQQVWCKTVLAGKRKLTIGDTFGSYLKKSRQSTSQVSASTNLFNFLSNYKASVFKRVMERGYIEVGVVDWKTVDGMTYTKDGAAVAGPAAGIPRLFMGAQDETTEEDDDGMEL